MSRGAGAFPTNRYVSSNIQLAERINQLEYSPEQTVTRAMNGNDEGPIQSTDNERNDNDDVDAMVSHILQVAECIRDKSDTPDSGNACATGDVPHNKITDGTTDVHRDKNNR